MENVTYLSNLTQTLDVTLIIFIYFFNFGSSSGFAAGGGGAEAVAGALPATKSSTSIKFI